MKPLNDLVKIAIDAALEAGNRIMEIYATDDFGIEAKSDNSPLTKADLAAHHVIVEHLEKTGIPILSEEGKDLSYSERSEWTNLWIVDPIDGTKEFINRNGEFTVNTALISNHKPVAGVVFIPALGEMYFSTREIGSYKATELLPNGKLSDWIYIAKKLPLARTNRPYTVVASKSHLSDETKAYIETLEEIHPDLACISKGSSLKLCMVAEGSADCYPRFAPTMEWDTAAGQAICEHAGCSVIDWNTKSPLLYNREHLLNPWFLVERKS